MPSGIFRSNLKVTAIMKTRYILLACVLVASAAFAGEKPTVIQFKDLQAKLDANQGKMIAVRGGVDRVSPKQGMFTLADQNDAACGDGCTKASIVAAVPKELQAKMPKPKDEVIVVGKLQMTERGYALAVSELVVGKEAIKGYAN